MALALLPGEILLCVSDHLDKPADLNRLARVSRRFHHLFNGLLYRLDARSGKNTGLFWAAQKGFPQTLQLSLHEGGDVHARERWNKTPLQLAAMTGNRECVRVLLEHHTVDLTRHRFTGSWAAPAPGQYQLCRKVNLTYKRELTPLSLATMYGKTKIVKMLLPHYENYVSASGEPYDGNAPLVWAARYNRTNTLELLLEAGLDPTQVDPIIQSTPLVEAIINSSEAVVKVLLGDKRVDPTKADPYSKETPLMWAAATGNINILNMLLAYDGVQADVPDNDVLPKGTRLKHTPLAIASANGNVDVVKILLERPEVDIDAKDWTTGCTALSYSISWSKEAVTQALVAKGANVNLANEGGRRPLHVALDRRGLHIVELLLKAGADPNARHPDGALPLEEPLDSWQWELVELLLTHGADVNQLSKQEHSCLYLARAARASTTILQMMLAKGAVLTQAEIEKKAEMDRVLDSSDESETLDSSEAVGTNSSDNLYSSTSDESEEQGELEELVEDESHSN